MINQGKDASKATRETQYLGPYLDHPGIAPFLSMLVFPIWFKEIKTIGTLVPNLRLKTLTQD